MTDDQAFYYDDNWDIHTVDELRQENWAKLESIGEVVERKLARIRLGVYSEERRDGSVQEILEEIERILR